VVGLAVGGALHAGKVRNTLVAVVTAIPVALFALWASWVVWVYALLQRADAKVGLEAVWGFVNANALPLDYRATVRELIDAVRGFQSKTDDVDFEPLLADAGRLAAALEAFETRRGETTPEAVAAWNNTAIRLGRILNPVMYTRGGRFHHDPAEWSPILRATKRFTLPGLNKAEGLAPLRGTAEHGFLRTQLVREVNRARTAVRRALEAVKSLAV